jgi:TetR/AcrR family transcriptional regulator, transcriptional repressor for nem operon
MDINTPPPPSAILAGRDTSQRILDVASHLVQTRGFNGFSYADIAAQLAVTKASLHYHFPSKAELGRTLIERYTRDFAIALAAIDASACTEFEKLERYASIYESVLHEKRMCMCGMLAAESATLPEPMRQMLKLFFELNERWLAAVLEQGRSKGLLRFEGEPMEAAQMLVGALEGAMMLAHSWSDVKRFEMAAARLLAEFGPAKTQAQRSIVR